MKVLWLADVLPLAARCKRPLVPKRFPGIPSISNNFQGIPRISGVISANTGEVKFAILGDFLFFQVRRVKLPDALPDDHWDRLSALCAL